MFDTEENEPFGLECTAFDIIRIEAMEVGEKIDSETGLFSVLRYEKEYTLIEHNGDIKTFLELERLIDFLRDPQTN